MRKRLLLITITFSISFLLMGVLSLFSVDRLNNYIKYSDLMDHSGFVIDKIYDAEKSIRDIDRGERGYMLTKDTMYLRFMNNAVDSLHGYLSVLKALTKDNDSVQQSITNLNASVAFRIGALRNNIAYVDSSQSSVPSKFYYDSRQLMLDCSKILHTMHASESLLKESRYRDELFYEELTTKSIRWLLGIFCLVTLFLFIILVKEFRDRMRYQEELQTKVIDLKRSHAELQEIAYVTSHDLQEPLRKIQVFSNMLLYLGPDDAGEKQRANLERINNSAQRMQSLIKDLMSVTTLTKTDEQKKLTDLNRMLQFILINIDDRIKAREAFVEIKLLPALHVYEQQIKILFGELVENALKFSKAGVKPSITISHDIVFGTELNEINVNLQHKKFHRITVADNGIGFDNQFISKMFGIFQRLHQEEDGYEGKGIGLAICLRVMANHEGYIIADGQPGAGAKFKMYFPVEGG